MISSTLMEPNKYKRSYKTWSFRSVKLSGKGFTGKPAYTISERLHTLIVTVVPASTANISSRNLR